MKTLNLALAAALTVAAAHAFASDDVNATNYDKTTTFVATQTTTEANIEPAAGPAGTIKQRQYTTNERKAFMKSNTTNSSNFKAEKTRSNEATPEETN